MLAPVKWLKEYVNINVSTEELADSMTLTGSNVETITRLAEDISGVVVGKILSIEKHPNADKLVICQVDVGDEVVQIVTGASNIKEGQLVPVALHGSILPGGIKIKRSKLRGIESHGMMCSGDELNLKKADYPTAEEYGIMILQEDYSLGMDIKDALDLGGDVIDFEITPNRPDCLSIVGLAREAAVTLDTKFIHPAIREPQGVDDINRYAKVKVMDGELCPRYCAKVVKDIKVGPSPQWMRRRLAAAGVRPINNIVDITNYVMLELGQPMHAFDLEKLEEKTVVVRRARPDERITTLDGMDRKLDVDMLVIADAKKPVAVAGVMGGMNSEITQHTKDILLESAVFEGGSVRKTAKALGLRSEASTRFEKGLDIHNAFYAIQRAAQLIDELGAGTIVEGTIDMCSGTLDERIIRVKWQKINRLLGIDLPCEEICDILTRLDFKVTRQDEYIKVLIPSYRQDVEGVADLAEEVARIYGYNNIPITLLEHTPSRAAKTDKHKLTDLAKEVLVGEGLYEVVTYSFTSPKVYSAIGFDDPINMPLAVKISNPLGEDQSIMRTTLISNILEILSRNSNRSVERCKIFEINRIFLPKWLPLEELPVEKDMLCIGEYGECIDFYDLKGQIEVLLEEFGVLEEAEFVPYSHPTFHPGRTAFLKVSGKDIGVFGEVHPKVLTNYQLDIPVFLAELDFDMLVDLANMDKKYKQLPKHPAVIRDLAILVDKKVLNGQIEGIIRKYGGNILEDVKLFDIYEGNQVPEGFKSMAYSLTYRSKDRTLKDEEVNKIQEKIIQKLGEEINATLR